jgi:hypothetical protein
MAGKVIAGNRLVYTGEDAGKIFDRILHTPKTSSSELKKEARKVARSISDFYKKNGK